jgi:hypothetical protein
MQRKLILKYSTIYDKNWSVVLDKEYERERNKEIACEFISKIEELWCPQEDNIFEAIEFYSGLKWRVDMTNAYFVSNLNVSGFSDPLTVRMSNDYLKIAKTLIHELVHNILIQNDSEMKETFARLNQKFPGENIKTKVHIIVNAITEKVFSKIYGLEEAERIKKIEREYKGLRRAYEILDNIEINDNVIKSILDV